MKSLKRRLSEHEEFEIMRLVLDKFLWLGTGFVGFGLYTLVQQQLVNSAIYTSIGLIMILLFGWIVVKEFEQMR